MSNGPEPRLSASQPANCDARRKVAYHIEQFLCSTRALCREYLADHKVKITKGLAGGGLRAGPHASLLQHDVFPAAFVLPDLVAAVGLPKPTSPGYSAVTVETDDSHVLEDVVDRIPIDVVELNVLVGVSADAARVLASKEQLSPQIGGYGAAGCLPDPG